jgi:hypothetical protein
MNTKWLSLAAIVSAENDAQFLPNLYTTALTVLHNVSLDLQA